MSPWDMVAALGIYTDEQIDEMTWAECEEILNQELDKAFWRDVIKKPVKEASINKVIIKRHFFNYIESIKFNLFTKRNDLYKFLWFSIL